MEYRKLPKGNGQIGVLGLGMGGIQAVGNCVYCNHCQPCPAGIDIGIVNKYYDLALAGGKMTADHYGKLKIKADACIKCGHCDKRCPFKVKQQSKMQKIAEYFGKKGE